MRKKVFTIVFSLIMLSVSLNQVQSNIDFTLLTWNEGSFFPHYETGYAEDKTEEFDSSVTSSEIHVFETSGSHYHLYAGVYALIPVTDSLIEISFEGRATSSRQDQIIMGVGLIVPSTMEYLAVRRPYDYQSPISSSPHDTGFNTFVYSFDTEGNDELYLFFFYIDATSAFWDQNIYVKNLVLENITLNTNSPPIQTTLLSVYWICIPLSLITVIIIIRVRRKNN